MKTDVSQNAGVRWVPILLGPLLTLLTWFLAPEDYSRTVLGTLMVTVWTVTWWVTEAIPIPASSLLPAVLLPLFGVCDAGTAAKYYSHHLILLLLDCKNIPSLNISLFISSLVRLKMPNERCRKYLSNSSDGFTNFINYDSSNFSRN